MNRRRRDGCGRRGRCSRWRGCCNGGSRRRGDRSGRRRRRGNRCPLLGFDARHNRLNRDGRSFGDDDLGEDAGDRRWDLGVHLVGGNLENRFVALHFIAHFLEPARHRAFGNRLAHLGHDYVYSSHLTVLGLNYRPSAACRGLTAQGGGASPRQFRLRPMHKCASCRRESRRKPAPSSRTPRTSKLAQPPSRR
jgi:hypothetical protein